MTKHDIYGIDHYLVGGWCLQQPNCNSARSCTTLTTRIDRCLIKPKTSLFWSPSAGCLKDDATMDVNVGTVSVLICISRGSYIYVERGKPQPFY